MRKKILRERLLRQIKKSRKCWTWLGAKMGHYGYLQVDNRFVSVRRLSYQLLGKGPPLRDWEVRSTCGNSSCVNPRHLTRHYKHRSKGPVKQKGRRKHAN
jgi:hypothetical protein